MKRHLYAVLILLCALCYTACDDYETYSDMKKKERSAIDRYIREQGINVISETTFNAQGQTTNVEDNEFVLLSRNGVYMQIVRKGCGEPLEEDRTVNILCRFLERNILIDTILVRNDIKSSIYNSSTGTYIDVSQYVDKMSVKRTGTTFTATFLSGMMYMYHGSASVPAGWLVPLNYVNVGRPAQEGDEIAKVRLIVPHSQGTADATSSVYPCYYEITYVREK